MNWRWVYRVALYAMVWGFMRPEPSTSLGGSTEEAARKARPRMERRRPAGALLPSLCVFWSGGRARRVEREREREQRGTGRTKTWYTTKKVLQLFNKKRGNE